MSTREATRHASEPPRRGPRRSEIENRLLEAEETLEAIRDGRVDAVVVQGPNGEQIYTLKSADQPYRAMIEQMGEGAVNLGPGGLILYCNRTFAELVGVPLERLAGGAMQQFVAAEDEPVLAALLATEGGKCEVSLRRNDGTRLPVLLTATRFSIESVTSLCTIVTDLTAQRRQQEVEASNRAKDRFLATLSHELRTPLTPVLATVSSLEEDERLPEDVRERLAMMRRNVELEARLIDDMLDLTRIAQGKLELRRERVDLREVLEHALDTCCGELEAKELRVETDLAAADHELWADRPRLTQVFWNLLQNAVKFTPAGGKIRLRSWREPDGALALEVADTGIGIEPGLLPRLFNVFEQGERSVTLHYGGLGLGLAISRAIVERHGGLLTARSEGKGQGAAFTVRLPASQAPAMAVAPQPAPDANGANGTKPAGAPPLPDGRGLRILLVEDHPDTANALAELLGIRGFRVTTAGSVAAGLAAADAFFAGPDGAAGALVISDLGLPDGSGLDLMRQLVRRYPVRGIALSGYGTEDDVRKSLEAGFVRHITKPVNLQSLEAAIHQTTQLTDAAA